MPIQCFNITQKNRLNPLGFANVGDFTLMKSSDVSPEAILSNLCISLYCFDFNSGNAIFVETKPGVDLSTAPFIYNVQYANAIRVYAVPLQALVNISSSIPFDSKKLIFIHSVGRAGSTLASQIFANINGVMNLSEPEALTWLVSARLSNPKLEKQLKIIFDATIKILCREPNKLAYVIKGRSFTIELGDWIYEMYPAAKNMFLYRDAESWLVSSLRAFTDDSQGIDMQTQATSITNNLRPLVPLLNQSSTNETLHIVEVFGSMWLSVMERYVALSDQGLQMLPIYYDSWKNHPLETARKMLEFCNLSSDEKVLTDVLKRDSQGGTHLSRTAMSKKDDKITDEDLHKLQQLLCKRSVVNSADFRVPDTLKIKK